MNKIQFKVGKRLTQEKIKEILEVQTQKGLTATSLLEKASDENSKLHDLFEWDDSVAANEWRLYRARIIINEVKIVLNDKEYFAFENVSLKLDDSDDAKREYKFAPDIIDNEVWRLQMVKKAINQLTFWKKQYKNYNKDELDKVILEIEELEANNGN